jgi:hypothetical protein
MWETSEEPAMQAGQRSKDLFGTPNRRKTPAERAEEFAAVQAKLKQEAAERRAAAPAVKVTGSGGARYVPRGKQRSADS